MTIKEQAILQAGGNRIRTADREISIIGRIEEPLILILANVLSGTECEALIDFAQDRMQRAKIGTSRAVSDVRTSSGMFVEESENALIQTVEARVSELMHIPLSHAEPLQILHYQAGEEYRPHVDYFASENVVNNRISTLVMYLNDVEEGGERIFPRFSSRSCREKAAPFISNISITTHASTSSRCMRATPSPRGRNGSRPSGCAGSAIAMTARAPKSCAGALNCPALSWRFTQQSKAR